MPPPLELDRVLARLEDLPPLPDLSRRLAELIEDPRCNSDALAKLIETDASVSARVLRLANSAYYAVPGGVDSVQRAVRFMGFSTIHQLVLCLESQAMLEAAGRAPPAAMVAHDLAVATLAPKVAALAGLPRADSLWAAGLLHDVGRLALQVLFPEEARGYAKALAQGADHGPELERELLGVDHQRVGRSLAERWRYPPLLVQVIGDHHGEGQPPAPGGEAWARLSDAVALADAWAWQLERAPFPSAQRRPASAARAARLGLSLDVPPAQRQALLEALDAAQKL